MTPEFALSTLLEFGLKYSKGLEGRPARIEVRDPALRDALADALAKLSTSVAVVADLTAVREVLNNLETEATGGRRFPGVLESPGVTPDRLRAFAEAAASFYRPGDQQQDRCKVSSANAVRTSPPRVPRDAPARAY